LEQSIITASSTEIESNIKRPEKVSELDEAIRREMYKNLDGSYTGQMTENELRKGKIRTETLLSRQFSTSSGHTEIHPSDISQIHDAKMEIKTREQSATALRNAPDRSEHQRPLLAEFEFQKLNIDERRAIRADFNNREEGVAVVTPETSMPSRREKRLAILQKSANNNKTTTYDEMVTYNERGNAGNAREKNPIKSLDDRVRAWRADVTPLPDDLKIDAFTDDDELSTENLLSQNSTQNKDSLVNLNAKLETLIQNTNAEVPSCGVKEAVIVKAVVPKRSTVDHNSSVSTLRDTIAMILESFQPLPFVEMQERASVLVTPQSSFLLVREVSSNFVRSSQVMHACEKQTDAILVLSTYPLSDSVLSTSALTLRPVNVPFTELMFDALNLKNVRPITVQNATYRTMIHPTVVFKEYVAYIQHVPSQHINGASLKVNPMTRDVKVFLPNIRKPIFALVKPPMTVGEWTSDAKVIVPIAMAPQFSNFLLSADKGGTFALPSFVPVLCIKEPVLKLTVSEEKSKFGTSSSNEPYPVGTSAFIQVESSINKNPTSKTDTKSNTLVSNTTQITPNRIVPSYEVGSSATRINSVPLKIEAPVIKPSLPKVDSNVNPLVTSNNAVAPNTILPIYQMVTSNNAITPKTILPQMVTSNNEVTPKTILPTSQMVTSNNSVTPKTTLATSQMVTSNNSVTPKTILPQMVTSNNEVTPKTTLPTSQMVTSNYAVTPKTILSTSQMVTSNNSVTPKTILSTSQMVTSNNSVTPKTTLPTSQIESKYQNINSMLLNVYQTAVKASASSVDKRLDAPVLNSNLALKNQSSQNFQDEACDLKITSSSVKLDLSANKVLMSNLAIQMDTPVSNINPIIPNNILPNPHVGTPDVNIFSMPLKVEPSTIKAPAYKMLTKLDAPVPKPNPIAPNQNLLTSTSQVITQDIKVGALKTAPAATNNVSTEYPQKHNMSDQAKLGQQKKIVQILAKPDDFLKQLVSTESLLKAANVSNSINNAHNVSSVLLPLVPEKLVEQKKSIHGVLFNSKQSTMSSSSNLPKPSGNEITEGNKKSIQNVILNSKQPTVSPSLDLSKPIRNEVTEVTADANLNTHKGSVSDVQPKVVLFRKPELSGNKTNEKNRKFQASAEQINKLPSSQQSIKLSAMGKSLDSYEQPPDVPNSDKFSLSSRITSKPLTKSKTLDSLDRREIDEEMENEEEDEDELYYVIKPRTFRYVVILPIISHFFHNKFNTFLKILKM